MRIHHKNTFIFVFILFLSTLFPTFGYTKIYKWEDFTEPFIQEFDLSRGHSITIEVFLPDFIINKYKKIPLYVNNNFNYLSLHSPSVQINNSTWAIYNFTSSKILEIKAKHLKHGINKLKFSSKNHLSGYQINEIGFDLPNMASIKAQYSEYIASVTKTGDSYNKEKKPQNDSSEYTKKDNQNHQIENLNTEKDYQYQEGAKLKEAKVLDASLNKNTRQYLQYALKHLGYYHGNSDGIFGANTRQSIKSYQKSRGDKPTGYFKTADVDTLIQLGKLAAKNAEDERLRQKKEALVLADKDSERKKKELVELKSQLKEELRAELMAELNPEIKKEDNNKIETNTQKEVEQEDARKAEEKIRKDLMAKKEKERLAEKKNYEESSSEKINSEKNQCKLTIQRPAESEAQYKELTDEINLTMNEELYNKMVQKIQDCALTGDYIFGTFISQHLYLIFTDLTAMSKNSAEVNRNTRAADNFKNARDEMLMYYCSDKRVSCTLPSILKKCELYYSKTKTRILYSEN